MSEEIGVNDGEGGIGVGVIIFVDEGVGEELGEKDGEGVGKEVVCATHCIPIEIYPLLHFISADSGPTVKEPLLHVNVVAEVLMPFGTVLVWLTFVLEALFVAGTE